MNSAYDIDLQWRFFPLHPDTPEEGLPLSELFAGRGYDLDAMYTQMKVRMDAEGLEYGPRTHTYNSRLAQELAKWADTAPGGGAVHGALYRAYFVEGRNIGDREVLIAVASELGLPESEARRVVDDRPYRDAVDEDWMRARRYGLRGVPTFVCDGQGVVGAQPYEVIEGLIRRAGAPRRPPAEPGGETRG